MIFAIIITRITEPFRPRVAFTVEAQDVASVPEQAERRREWRLAMWRYDDVAVQEIASDEPN